MSCGEWEDPSGVSVGSLSEITTKSVWEDNPFDDSDKEVEKATEELTVYLMGHNKDNRICAVKGVSLSVSRYLVERAKEGNLTGWRIRRGGRRCMKSYFGDDGEAMGERTLAGEYRGDVGLNDGDCGLYRGEVGENDGEVGEYRGLAAYGDVPKGDVVPPNGDCGTYPRDPASTVPVIGGPRLDLAKVPSQTPRDSSARIWRPGGLEMVDGEGFGRTLDARDANNHDAEM
ncbi:hypothetical protein C8J57DRAFT_1250978 [Mycena rebaudengoi]|nr:hypothetical protein C8J57DRAFT_1250978 [Mycena rebaudengoi]